MKRILRKFAGDDAGAEYLTRIVRVMLASILLVWSAAAVVLILWGGAK